MAEARMRLGGGWGALLIVWCLSAAADGAAYDSSYVYMRARDASTGKERVVCANYQQFLRRKLPTSPDEAQELRLALLRAPDGRPSENMCGATKPADASPTLLPSSYRLNKTGTAVGCPPPGVNVTRELDWQVNNLTKDRPGLKALVFLVKRGQEYLRYDRRPVKDVLFWEFRDGFLNDSAVSVPVYYTYDSVWDEVMGLGEPEDLRLSFYRPSQLKLDPAMAIVLLLATGAVWIGGWWSGRIRRDLLAKERVRDERAKARPSEQDEAEAADDASETESRASTPEPATAPFTWLSIAFFVFVIVGMLLLLYFFYQYFVWFIIVMYTVAGASAMRECLCGALDGCLGERLGWRLPASVEGMWESLTGRGCCSSALRSRWRWRDLVVGLGCLAFCVSWCVLRNAPFAFAMQDTISIFFSINLIKTLRLPNLKYLACLLLALLFYDLFMVFVTPLMTSNGCSVMVEVATGSSYCRGSGEGRVEGPPGYPIQPSRSSREQLPILVVVPRLADPMLDCYDVTASPRLPATMLGLGDIILPGLLVGFCFGADAELGSGRGWGLGFYGPLSVLAYALGLVLTFAALLLSKVAQPALIYLVPTTLAATVLAGLCRGELKRLWHGPHLSPDPLATLPTTYASIQRPPPSPASGAPDRPPDPL